MKENKRSLLLAKKIAIGLLICFILSFTYFKYSKVDSIEGKWIDVYALKIKEFKDGVVYSQGLKFGTYERIDDNTWLISFLDKTSNSPRIIQYKMWGNYVSLSMEDYNHRFYKYETNRTLIKYFYEPFGL